jgi:2-keto-4-pentenoate hydratase
MPDHQDAIDIAVTRLARAWRSGQTVSAAGLALPDAAAAYAAQDGVAAALGWFGGAPAQHWKSGAGSRDEVPTHAPLPPAGVWPSPASARSWPFRRRGIEAEVALRLAHDVDAAQAAALDPERAGALVDAMCVSIEIVDSRWTEGRDAPALARLADLQSHGALVLGAWTPYRTLDWAAQSCRARIGTGAPAEWRGTHPLGDPAWLLPAWLRHATRDGRTLRTGSVVTTGSWVGLLAAAAGDLVVVEFPGIGAASVQL